ncbi:hypothetical protein KHS38_12950 [Mucilaginibacter sp. Bleaf8]|uniref:hypothetical protein n=1 Tax=Mucilaginibacter sp. Bleaf8 TaxID=2834430 RepID=UPI001BCE1C6C|nr:hypothetical protein [Mucilaginibacter sp. Bleaf8]MBS7565314.1 hypothetical protein [Mucilaginibacter sp. Bleaf8]
MTRTEILQLLKNVKIEDLLETDVWRENDPLIICGFTLDNGYTVYLKPISGSDSVELSVGWPAGEAEMRSFKEKLDTAAPDSYFDFSVRHLSLETVRRLTEEHARTIKAGGCSANEIWNGTIRVRFDPTNL